MTLGGKERLARQMPGQRPGGMVVEQARVRRRNHEREVGIERQPLPEPRLLTFRDQHRLGVCRVEPRPQVPPDRRGGRVAVAEHLVLDEREGHVHAEARDASAEPKVQNLLQRSAIAHRAGRVDGVAPGLLRIRADPAKVQRRLLLIEILEVPPRPRPRRLHPAGDAGQINPPARRLDLAPDVPVTLGARTRSPQLRLEPGVLDGGVPDDEIEQDAYAARPRLLDQLDEIVVGAIARRDPQVVGHVVSRVEEG